MFLFVYVCVCVCACVCVCLCVCVCVCVYLREVPPASQVVTALRIANPLFDKPPPTLSADLGASGVQTDSCALLQARAVGSGQAPIYFIVCPGSRACVALPFGSWADGGAAGGLTAPVHLSAGLGVAAARVLPFTRHCLTSSSLCTSQSSFHSSGPPALPTLLQYYCTTIGQYATPPRPPFCMPYTLQYW